MDPGAKEEELSSGRTMEIYPSKSPFVSAYWREKYERDAKRNWDKFYLRNSDRFFKDRHYLDKEWGSYFGKLNNSINAKEPNGSSTTEAVVLEVGCGAGNTIFPLLAEYPHIFLYACDFSPRAIDIVKANKEYCGNRVHAFVCDVTSEALTKEIPLASVDIATLVFMLSAVSPERMPDVLQNIRRILKPGGHILLRDYAVGDLSEERFKNRDQQISANFFVRGDGTRAFYFSEDHLTELFMKEGFIRKSVHTVAKVVENRSRGLMMHRRWIQGVFCLEKTQVTDTDAEVGLEEGIGMEMFGEIPVVEESEVQVGEYRIRAKCIPRVHQHTYRNTGLMLWESALALSELLLQCPALVAGRRVLELGCGCLGVCSLVASIAARQVVATDADTDALALLQENLKANSHTFPVHKVLCHKLRWGDSEDISDLLEPSRFEIILGTDVTYVSEALPALFDTAKELLCEPSTGIPDPVLLLCHLARKVTESEIVATAESSGFILKCRWLSTDERLPAAAAALLLSSEWKMATATLGPILFLWFAKGNSPMN